MPKKLTENSKQRLILSDKLCLTKSADDWLTWRILDETDSRGWNQVEQDLDWSETEAKKVSLRVRSVLFLLAQERRVLITILEFKDISGIFWPVI